MRVVTTTKRGRLRLRHWTCVTGAASVAYCRQAAVKTSASDDGRELGWKRRDSSLACGGCLELESSWIERSRRFLALSNHYHPLLPAFSGMKLPGLYVRMGRVGSREARKLHLCSAPNGGRGLHCLMFTAREHLERRSPHLGVRLDCLGSK